MDLCWIFGFEECGAEVGAVLYALLGFPLFFFFFFGDACGGGRRRRRRRRLRVEVTALAEPEAGGRESVARVEICVVEGGFSGGGEVGGVEEAGEVGGVEGEFLFDFEEGHCYFGGLCSLGDGDFVALRRSWFGIVRGNVCGSYSCWNRSY